MLIGGLFPMSENPVMSVDKKTWNKWSFYINIILFIVVALFIYLVIIDSFNAGKVFSENDASLLTNAWFVIVRDVAFLSAGLVILFVQMFNYYRQLSRRSW
jgi:SNF family Na+-dependent transporter